jgi:hypothetical protein
MKAYLISPTMDVFDGTGTLTSDASRALDLIAGIVADSLRDGGDGSHQAVVWDGPSMVDQHASIVALADRESVISLLRKMGDPNNLVGGQVRSVINCRAATFGYDGQAFLCLRHEDTMPVSPDPALATVEQHSEWLTEGDWLDGWPSI